MIALTLGVSLLNRTIKDMTEEIQMYNISVVNYAGSTDRFWNMTQVSEQEIYRWSL